MREDFVTLSEAKIRLHGLVKELPSRPTVLLLRHGRPVAAMLDYSRYVALLERIEELEDEVAVAEAESDLEADMTVPWDKVQAEAGPMGSTTKPH